MWSSTYRELMLRHYGVSIGLHSYGPSLFPGRVPEGTRVGNYCSLASGIVVFRRNHPTQRFCQHPFFYNAATGLLEDDAIDAVRDHPLEIEHDVWIGANSIITPRCRTIGLGAVVGAGSVVTKDVAAFTIVAGSPARKIGERFTPEIQSILREARWWDFPIDMLTPVLPAFLEDASLESAKRLLDHTARARQQNDNLSTAAKSADDSYKAS